LEIQTVSYETKPNEAMVRTRTFFRGC